MAVTGTRPRLATTAFAVACASVLAAAVVAAAARGDLVLVMFGIGLSIPIVVWGSGLLARLMNRYGWIIWIGGAVLGVVVLGESLTVFMVAGAVLIVLGLWLTVTGRN